MTMEGNVHCEGPDCENRAHVGADTLAADRLPIGFMRIVWYGRADDDHHDFCNGDCAMKWLAANTEPPIEVEVPDA